LPDLTPGWNWQFLPVARNIVDVRFCATVWRFGRSRQHLGGWLSAASRQRISYAHEKENMSRSALSARGFAVYVFIVGAALVVAPNVLLSIFRLAPTSEIWIRLLGAVAFNIGVFAWVGAQDSRFLRATVYTRAGFFLAVTVFVVTGMAPATLIVFGMMDLLGATWTWWALWADGRGTRRAPAQPGSDGARPCAGPCAASAAKNIDYL
jgi:hypothetical protein